MLALDQAVYAKLTGDATLTAMLASALSVWNVLAPEGQAAPFVVFQSRGSTDAYTFAKRAWSSYTLQVKGICDGSSPLVAEQIADRCDAVLTDQPLLVAGVGAMVVRRYGEIPAYAEQVDGRTTHHRGSLFTIGVLAP